MPYTPDRHHRRSIRLPDYDYPQAGAYFVTLCTHQRDHLFGEVVNGEMQLSTFGQIVAEEWFASAHIRREIELDAFVVMPNHIHGIVWIAVGAHSHAPPPTTVQAHGRAPQHTTPIPTFHRKPRSLGAFVAGCKSAVTKRINALRNTPNAPAWQRNYYEYIIRDERALDTICTYIVNNPSCWAATDTATFPSDSAFST